jgi:ADP-heptose:LPS heptosyltransferase
LKPDTLVILHQGAIGDFLLTLPVIQSAREHLQAGHCVVAASAASARLAAGRSVVDAWLSPETLGVYRLFCRDLEPARPLADLLSEARWVLNLLTGPSGCVHDRLKELTAGQLVSIDPRPTEETRESRRHISVQWTDAIRAVGWNLAEPRHAAIQFPHPPARSIPRVLIHPGSGGQSKCWPIERFIVLADAIKTAEVSWMVGPAEGEVTGAIQERGEPIVYEPELFKAAQRMAACDLYVGNDGGATHLAAAVGVRTVAIFGTTDPQVWRPLGNDVTVISPEQVEDSMEGISLEQVRETVAYILREHGSV